MGTPWERVLPPSTNQVLRVVASVDELLLILGKPSCLLEMGEDEDAQADGTDGAAGGVRRLHWLIVVLPQLLLEAEGDRDQADACRWLPTFFKTRESKLLLP